MKAAMIGMLRTIPLALVLAASGCRNAAVDSSFDRVQHAVHERTGHQVQWRQTAEDDAAIADVVSAALADPITVDAAVRIALLNNASLQATFEELGIAHADLVQAGLLRNPTFAASVRPTVGSSGASNLELSLVQPFMDAFVLPARKRLAQAQFDQALLRVSNEAIELAAETASAFYALQAAQQRLALQRQVAEAADVRGELAQRQFEAGNISELDMARQQAAVHEARMATRVQQAQVAMQRQQLGRSMGLRGSTPWDVEGELSSLPDSEPDEEQIIATALSQRLDLQLARSELQIVEHAMNLTRKGLWTEVELGASAERDADGTWVVGPELQIALPLFDQGQASIARLQAQQRQAQRRVQAMETDIDAEVREAYARLQAARATAHYLSDVVIPLRQRIVNLSQQQYNAMLMDVYALLIAKQDEVEALSEHVDSLQEYWQARTELQRLAGGMLPPPIAEEAAPTVEPGMPPTSEQSSDPHEHRH